MQQACTHLAAAGNAPGGLRADQLMARLQGEPGFAEQT
jgi:hypothetical protein